MRLDGLLTPTAATTELIEQIEQAGPFGAVPAEVSAGNDLLLISSRFRFTRDAGMEATTEKAAPISAP